MSKKIRVLIVDDSALIRKLLQDIIDSDPALEVVGTASDPFFARDKIKQLQPDVITLDVEMPRMDGITFLKNLMRLRPMPVVMVSTLTQHGADVTLQALELGAVDYIGKPQGNVAELLPGYAELIVEKIKAAAVARVRCKEGEGEAVVPLKAPAKIRSTRYQMIAIGASTGGTEAIREVLQRLGDNLPPIVITQHIPKEFSTSFARRLDKSCAMTVVEAEAGMKLTSGYAYIAPGDQHLLIKRSGDGYVCALDNGEPINRHKPSVDAMFASISQLTPKNTIALLLTGMGIDGAKELKSLKNAGALTLVQDEESSVVWGMPGHAVQLGAATEVHSLERLPKRLMECLSEA